MHVLFISICRQLLSAVLHKNIPFQFEHSFKTLISNFKICM